VKLNRKDTAPHTVLCAGEMTSSTAVFALIGEVVRSGRRAVDSCYGFLRIY